MPRHPSDRFAAGGPHVLPLRAASSGTPVAALLAPLAAEITAGRRHRGQPLVGITLDADAGQVAASDAGPLRDLLRLLVESACEAAAAAPLRLREVVVTTVVGPGGLEIEVADSGPDTADAKAGLRIAAAGSLVERLSGTLACRACPEGGLAVTLHLPRRNLQRQAA